MNKTFTKVDKHGDDGVDILPFVIIDETVPTTLLISCINTHKIVIIDNTTTMRRETLVLSCNLNLRPSFDSRFDLRRR